MIIGNMIEQTRIRLRYPHPTSPNRETILLELRASFQKLHNRLTNKAAPWSLECTDICFSAGSDKGTIVNVRNVGVIQYVHTLPSDQTQGEQREIQLIKPQNIDQFYGGPLTATQGESVEHTAEVMAPYFEQGQLYFMVRPIPQKMETYRLWYKPGFYEPDGLAAEPPLQQFHPMIVADAVRKLAGHCVWLGLDANATAKRAADIERSMTDEYAENMRDFEQYISSLNVAQPQQRRAYGDEYLERSSQLPDMSALWK